MKKFAFLMIYGTVLLATPCYSQMAKRISITEKCELENNIVILDHRDNRTLLAIYGVDKVCPYGYAIYDPKADKYSGCEKVDEFQKNLNNGTYEQLEDGALYI